MKKSKALVLFSGGQDSTTCLYWAKNKFSEVTALNIFYGQRHHLETVCARKITELAQVPLVEIDLSSIFNQVTVSALLNKKENINEVSNITNLPASFVPGRNLLFLTVVSMYAYKNDISDIVTGVCQTDYSGYPDCRSNTISSLNTALSLGMDYILRIHTPLMWLSKKDTVKLAQELPGCFSALAYSHTCYEGTFPPCGQCPACKLRQKGFIEANEMDPLLVRALQL